MFEPKHNVSPHEQGYTIEIHYNRVQDTYYVTGYTVMMDNNNRIKRSQDGATLPFNSMAEAMSHLLNYGEPKRTEPSSGYSEAVLRWAESHGIQIINLDTKAKQVISLKEFIERWTEPTN